MQQINLTLIEQMQITDDEIARRKELLGFTSADVELLLSCKDLVEEQVDSIVADFYARQTAQEEIALLIGDADTLRRLHQAQRSYVLELFAGFYDMEYINSRLRIGMVHKRIGVEPKLYLAAIKTLKDTITETLQRHIPDRGHCEQVVQALHKLTYFDITLVFDTYIRAMLAEVELAKNRVSTYARSLEEKVATRTRELAELSQRDSLTGLYNQRAFREMLRRELITAKRRQTPLALVYLDVDKFKEVNDTRGHHAGDGILRMVGEAMKEVARECDLPCRCGGDEFGLILPDCSVGHAEEVCRRLIEVFSRRVGDVALSIGIAQTGPLEFMDVDDLVRRADSRMYEAKTHPGFRVCA